MLLSAAGVVLAGAIAASALAERDDEDRNDDGRYAIGLWGDLPYSDLQAQVGGPNLITDMNDQKLAFTVHDGDLKAGNGTPGSVTPTICSDALYVQGLGFFNSLHAPAMLTPGDNDWTDRDRPSNGTAASIRWNVWTTSAKFSSPRLSRWDKTAFARKCRRRPCA